MLYQQQIPALVRMLKGRSAQLFHACQLQDFRSYLQLGGIPSRAVLERSGLPFTAFKTDQNDRTNGVWEKVFANLNDFGEAFADGDRAPPNAYGPILLRMRPDALHSVDDVAVAVKSAGGRGFNRERESLKSVAEVDWLFAYPASVGHPRSNRLKFRKALRAVHRDAETPEVSFTLQNGVLPLSHVSSIVVDPYVLDGRPLVDTVRQDLAALGCAARCQQRSIFRDPGRKPLYAELQACLASGVPSLVGLYRSADSSPGLRIWADGMLTYDLEWQYRRYAQYLRTGTIDLCL